MPFFTGIWLRQELEVGYLWLGFFSFVSLCFGRVQNGENG